jgi:hypothetical protein
VLLALLKCIQYINTVNDIIHYKNSLDLLVGIAYIKGRGRGLLPSPLLLMLLSIFSPFNESIFNLFIPVKYVGQYFPSSEHELKNSCRFINTDLCKLLSYYFYGCYIINLLTAILHISTIE